MNVNKVKHDKCNRPSDTSLYLQSGINVLSSCHFTYSPKTQHEHNFWKSLLISHRVNALQLNFLEILCYHILSSHKSLAQINNKCKVLIPMISRNELFITFSTLWSYQHDQMLNDRRMNKIHCKYLLERIVSSDQEIYFPNYYKIKCDRKSNSHNNAIFGHSIAFWRINKFSKVPQRLAPGRKEKYIDISSPTFVTVSLAGEISLLSKNFCI